jgi:hypothetical protein
MLRVTMFASALLAALGTVAVGAITVSASGHEFVAGKTGKTTSRGTGPQVFTTTAGSIECSTVTGSGSVTETKSAVHKETLTYSGCEAFGGRASVGSLHFEFNAGGSARLEKSVAVKAEGAGCEVTVPAQTVQGVGYANEAGGKLKAVAEVTGIHSKGSGGACGGESSEGTYKGTMSATLEGSTIEWR